MSLRSEIYRGKRVGVLGLGKSGRAAVRLLAHCGAQIRGFDESASAHASDGAHGEEIFRATSDPLDAMRGLDLLVTSPGLDPRTPLFQAALASGVPIIGEIELAWSVSDLPVVGITGTNGKSTTTELTAAALTACGVRTVAAGNIGVPYSDAILDHPELDLVTLEISSFQVEHIRTFRPRVAAWLNFAPDHLDRYASQEEYRDAKLHIFDHQTADDFAVVNAADDFVCVRSRRSTFSARCAADFTLADGLLLHHGQPVLRQDETQLPGPHNAENMLACLAIVAALGHPLERAAGALRAYAPLRHRCEFIRERDGVRYVNDSKATNLDSMEKAILAQPGGIVLIAGGKNKGIDYTPLRELVAQRVHHVVLIGELSEHIEQVWGSAVPCLHAARSFARAIELAAEQARPGDTVLLSPGTSSFDMFRDYADRGDQFRDLVQRLA